MSLPWYVSIIYGHFRPRIAVALLDNRFWVSIRIVCAATLIFAALGVNSQSINGSIYSYYGIGNLQARSSAYTRGLGYTGVGIRDDYHINALNPAAYNAIAKPFTALFEIGANYEATSHQTSDASSISKSGGLNGINFLFKVSPKWGFGVGAAPLSNISYNASSTITFGALSTPTQVINEGSGGINQFYAGSAFEVLKNLSLGANISYYLGTIKKIETVAPTGVTGQLIVANRATAHNLGGDVGAQYLLSLKKAKIIIGATWDPGTFLSGMQQTSIVNTNFDTLKKTDKIKRDYRMPPTYGGGISLKINRSTLAADLHWADWKNAVLNDDQVYQNSFKYSLGYEYRGDLTSVKYLNAISFRAGGFVQDYPVLVKNTALTTWGYTVGISLPLDNYRASMNINYSFIQLGTLQNGLVKEQSNKIVLDFIIRDIWGIKRKFD